MIRKLFMLVFLLAALAVGLVILVFFGAGRVVKAGVVKVGPVITGVPVALDSASVSILSGKGELSGLEVGNPAGYRQPFALRVGRIELSLQPKTLLEEKVVVKRIGILAPEITLEGGLKENNLSDILDHVKSIGKRTSGGGGGEAQGDGGKKIQVDEVVISGATLRVSNKYTVGQAVPVNLPEIRVASLGQGPDGITSAELTERLIQEILDRAGPVVAEALAKQGIRIFSDDGEDAGGAMQSLKKITEGVGGLLNRQN